MRTRYYRVWVSVEEVNETEGGERKLVEQTELAAFHTLEEALTYRYELSQKYSPKNFSMGLGTNVYRVASMSL